MRFLIPRATAVAPLLALCPAALRAEEVATETLDTAANGFIIICAMLVLLMTAPAIGLFYGGMARARNVLSVLEQCLVVVALAFIIWTLIGYTLAFGSADGNVGDFIGDFSALGLLGITPDTLNGSLSAYTYIAFQGAFCAIASTLIIGATVERIRFSAVIFAVSLWIVFSYAPLAHQVWGGGFIDRCFHAFDFAGGTVVHINAGVCGLVGALMLGRRSDLGRKLMPPHNVTHTYIGACLLWMGWFGFNAGSELAADGISALAFINTAIAPCAAALAWMAGEWIFFGKPSTLGTASGLVAGLVGITPACAFVGPLGAIAIGVASGFTGLWGVHGFKKMIRIDDALDVFGVHGLCGIVGSILTGVFCAPGLGGTGFAEDWGNMAGQVYGQTMSVVISVLWSGVVAFVAFGLAGKIFGLRVTHDEEAEGLDLASHGERAYNL